MVRLLDIDFRYLVREYGLPSARDIFEEITFGLLKASDPEGDYRRVRLNPGDKGRDVIRGRITRAPRAWQCKFFPGGLQESQKGQVRESFNNAMDAAAEEGVSITGWTLCLPIDLSTNEMNWFDTWSDFQEQKHGIKISHMFLSEYKILSSRHPEIFDAYFDPDARRPLPAVPETVDFDESFFMRRVRQSTIDGRHHKHIQWYYYYATQFDIERRQYGLERINTMLDDLIDRLEMTWTECHGACYTSGVDEDGNDLYEKCSELFRYTEENYRTGTIFRGLLWQHLLGYLFVLTDKDVVYWTREKMAVSTLGR